MREQLTRSDVRKIEEEIEYRKLVVRKEALEEFLREYEGMDLSDLENIKPIIQAS